MKIPDITFEFTIPYFSEADNLRPMDYVTLSNSAYDGLAQIVDMSEPFIDQGEFKRKIILRATDLQPTQEIKSLPN